MDKKSNETVESQQTPKNVESSADESQRPTEADNDKELHQALDALNLEFLKVTSETKVKAIPNKKSANAAEHASVKQKQK